MNDDDDSDDGPILYRDDDDAGKAQIYFHVFKNLYTKMRCIKSYSFIF